MGEATIRGNVSHGDGVYKSTDAGKTWHAPAACGDTRNIGKVRVHPHESRHRLRRRARPCPWPQQASAASTARATAARRGTACSMSGEDVGIHDLSIDPNNPRILYAAAWTRCAAFTIS